MAGRKGTKRRRNDRRTTEGVPIRSVFLTEEENRLYDAVVERTGKSRAGYALEAVLLRLQKDLRRFGMPPLDLERRGIHESDYGEAWTAQQSIADELRAMSRQFASLADRLVAPATPKKEDG